MTFWVLLAMGGSPGDVSENPVMYEKRKRVWEWACDVGEATEGLENELWRRWSDWKLGEWAELIQDILGSILGNTLEIFLEI